MPDRSSWTALLAGAVVFAVLVSAAALSSLIPTAAPTAPPPTPTVTAPPAPAATVPAPATPAEPADDPCGATGRRNPTCVQDRFDELVEGEGAAAAMAELERLTGVDDDVLVACHGYAHTIGEAAALRHPDLDEAMAEGSQICQFGYYHGLFVGRAAGSSAEEFASAVPSLCSYFATESQFSYSSCIHGIGHAAVQIAGADLAGGVLFCDNLAEGTDRENCANGVVMEFASSQAPTLLEDDAAGTVTACSTIPARYARPCYREISAVWLMDAPGDFAAAHRRCDTLAGADVDECYLGIGFRLGTWELGDTAGIAAACSTGDPAWQQHCYGGAATVQYETYYRTDPGLAEGVCPSAADVDVRAGCEKILDRTRAGYAQLNGEPERTSS